MNSKHILSLLEPYQEKLLNHSLYNQLKTIDDLHLFLENHVFAVWDYMSLLKALQNKLTGTTLPWMPVGNPSIRYLINEIVLTEETDLSLDKYRQSHYEMYVDAMQQCGANSALIAEFLEEVESTKNIFVSIKRSKLHSELKAFLDFTFRVIEQGESHEIAAAFTFGRENLIPLRFTEILKNFQVAFPETDLSKLIYYFERQSELETKERKGLAMKMTEELCGEDERKWDAVASVAVDALEKRINLWNAIEEMILQPELSF
ncbi:DUF3050 domain-containing protein [Flavobacterium sp.]|uniref:DUF3050 domain-containing protein n=1 Tax=Flavobacterium sp. TaxID=239 RepID=UPI002622A6C6|nr:DUF3050 domain-containing protein [Flavobacterium sp.]MDD2985404.1 DUF3050 domain-containing protein [Flavobacterium sp.]